MDCMSYERWNKTNQNQLNPGHARFTSPRFEAKVEEGGGVTLTCLKTKIHSPKPVLGIWGHDKSPPPP